MSDIYERQKEWLDLSHAAHEAIRMRNEEKELAGATFRPATNPDSDAATLQRSTMVLPLLAGTTSHRERVRTARLRAVADKW